MDTDREIEAPAEQEEAAAEPGSQQTKHGIFPRTRWTLLQQMQNPEVSQLGAEALNEFCQIYWRPVYIYIRSWNKSPADAEDLTQGFFSMILAKHSLDFVAPEKGKLRTYLLVALRRFLANARDRESALKRGGGKKPISIDVEWADGHSKIFEPAGGVSPDVLFDRQWALTVLDRALSQLRQVYASEGKLPVFEALIFAISPSVAKLPLAEVADGLGISVGAAKVASHRLRQRYRHVLQKLIAETVGSEDAVNEEIRYLMSVFSQ